MYRAGHDGTRHALGERWELTPDRALHIYRDLYGNTCQRFSLPQGPECLRYEALVEALDAGDEVDVNAVPYPVEDRPPTTLIDTLPGRYCLSDVHFDTARDLQAPVLTRTRSCCGRRTRGQVRWVNQGM